MNINSNKWLKTLPNQEKETQLNSEAWIKTIPKKNNKRFIKKNHISIFIFIIGLVCVSLIKNDTRNLQKEINILQASIDNIKFDLRRSTLDHEVITSPENISRLAKEYLDPGFSYYKRSQLNILPEKNTANQISKKSTNKNNKENAKFLLTKAIKTKKLELEKLEKLYSNPNELPGTIKLKIVKKIEFTKNSIKNFYDDPVGSISSKKKQRWLGFQVVKLFFGFPIIPGK